MTPLHPNAQPTATSQVYTQPTTVSSSDMPSHETEEEVCSVPSDNQIQQHQQQPISLCRPNVPNVVGAHTIESPQMSPIYSIGSSVGYWPRITMHHWANTSPHCRLHYQL